MGSVHLNPGKQDLSGKSNVGHDHDDRYSLLAHNHDAAYSALNHNHDAAYAALGHNHDGTYSPAGHTHDYVPLASGFGETTSGIKVGGTRVLATQQGAIPSVQAGAVAQLGATSTEQRDTINAILAALRAHGIIATA